MTINDLIESTIRYQERRAHPPKIEISEIKARPFVPLGIAEKIRAWVLRAIGKRHILYEARVRSEKSDEAYLVQILGESMTNNELSLNTTVKVRCSCPDFTWRFGPYNYEHRALLGKKYPLYTKKTNRPPVNPDHIPGLCKHLMSVVQSISAIGEENDS